MNNIKEKTEQEISQEFNFHDYVFDSSLVIYMNQKGQLKQFLKSLNDLELEMEMLEEQLKRDYDDKNDDPVYLSDFEKYQQMIFKQENLEAKLEYLLLQRKSIKEKLRFTE